MNRDGFTLIESLVAIVLVAVVLPVALAAVNASLRGSDAVRQHDVARRVAESRLARLVADGSWSSGASSGSCDAATDGEDAVGLVWQVTVASWRDPVVRDLKVVIGRSADDPRSVAIETLVTPTGTTP